MNQHNTLLCWHSIRAGEDVLNNAIKALSNRKVSISKILLLKQEDQDASYHELSDSVEIEEILLELDEPTNHQAIYELLVEQVLPLVAPIKNLHINVSPGTPAMHAVWLILHAGGRLPKGTILWSSQKNPQTKRSNIQRIDFEINTYLSEIHTIQSENKFQATYDLEPKSAGRRKALELLKQFASLSGVPLLILGERGVGKTRLVETMISTIKQKRMEILPCGGLGSDLADSLLFGHRKGSFTGATEDRTGLLKRADEGVLFLDEIQDLPVLAQRKLVRLLQGGEKKFRPIGGDEEISVSFDLICASNKTIGELHELLDSDFFDRISMLTVKFPPLRECREDLLNDWRHVWAELRNVQAHPEKAPVTNELEEFFKTSALRGNLRYLQKLACLVMAHWADNDIANSVAMALKALDDDIRALETADDLDLTEGASRTTLLNKVKRKIAQDAKEQHGTWRKAAEALDCDEKTLRQDASLSDSGQTSEKGS